MSTWAIVGIVAATFVFMEFVAWATHKYVMHGFLWSLHRDHHRKDHYGFLEYNDSFFLIFAIPSMVLFIVGSLKGFTPPGCGSAWASCCTASRTSSCTRCSSTSASNGLRASRNVYFLGVRRAHKVHHKHLGKEDGECFGMLVVPFKYFREARESMRRQTAA
ncbi:MAG: sterol desaturase family protein [Flavobacteriales bacterium]